MPDAELVVKNISINQLKEKSICISLCFAFLSDLNDVKIVDIPFMTKF